MNVSSIAHLPFSARAAWPELAREDSKVARVFWFVVVPLSLLPPAMIFWAGRHHADAFVAGFGGRPWDLLAALAFFLCEIASVTGMGWLIRRVAGAWQLQVSGRNAYVLAAVAAIPLWLSSFGLFVPSLAFNVALCVLALCVSFALLFQGVRSFGSDGDEDLVRALDVSRLVFGGGLAAWGFLFLLLIV
jgi:hypothetical protein